LGSAFKASCFEILPPLPEPLTLLGSIPFSFKILDAAGDGDFTSFLESILSSF